MLETSTASALLGLPPLPPPPACWGDSSCFQLRHGARNADGLHLPRSNRLSFQCIVFFSVATKVRFTVTPLHLFSQGQNHVTHHHSNTPPPRLQGCEGLWSNMHTTTTMHEMSASSPIHAHLLAACRLFYNSVLMVMMIGTSTATGGDPGVRSR